MSRSNSQLKAVPFTEAPTNYAENQPEYNTLPTFAYPNDPQGKIVICWKLTWRQRVVLLLTGRLWHTVMTFNKPLQPIRLEVIKPDMRTPEEIEAEEAMIQEILSRA